MPAELLGQCVSEGPVQQKLGHGLAFQLQKKLEGECDLRECGMFDDKIIFS